MRDPTLLTLSDIQVITGISSTTLSRYLKLEGRGGGRLHPYIYKVGKRRMFDRGAVAIFEVLRDEGIGKRGRPQSRRTTNQEELVRRRTIATVMRRRAESTDKRQLATANRPSAAHLRKLRERRLAIRYALRERLNNARREEGAGTEGDHPVGAG